MSEPPSEPRPAAPPYRPLVPVAAAFALGIVAREYLHAPSAAIWGLTLASALAWPLARAAHRPRAGSAAFYALLVAAGWVRLDIAATPPPGSLARFIREEPKLVKLRGIVAGEVQTSVSSRSLLAEDTHPLAKDVAETRFDLDAAEVEIDGEWRPTSGRVRAVASVSLGEPNRKAATPAVSSDTPFQRRELAYGDQIVVLGSLAAPRPPSNPGQLDMVRLFRRRGIQAAMSVSPACLTIERHSRGNPVMALAQAARARVRRLVQTTLAASARAKALLCATLLGDKTELDEELEEAFKRSGTAHLLAVSGLNVGIMAWATWAIAALIGLGLGAAGALTLATTLLYAFACGLSPSVLRAAVMTAALVVSIMARRRLDLLQTTALAALVILAARPFNLFDAGFQLSFVAVLSILCLAEHLLALLRPSPSLMELLTKDQPQPAWRRLRRWLRPKEANALAVSLAAWLGVFPLLAYYFNLCSPVTVLVNLVAVPLYSFITIVGFAHVGIAALSPTLAAVPGWVLQGATAGLVAVIEAGARLPLAWTYCATPALGWVAAYYGLGLLLVMRSRLRLRGRTVALAWVVGLSTYLTANWGEPRPDGVEMTALDVRHGLAVALRYPDGSTLLYDCGTYGRSDVGRWIVAPALWHWGVRRIDLLVVSHSDVDHINGIPALIERFPIGRVLCSPVLWRSEPGRRLLTMLHQRGIPFESARAGDRFELGRGNRLEVLAPTGWTLRHLPKDQNENSLVLCAQHEGRRILLGADIQRVGAVVLPHLGTDIRADVLLVPHHGCEMKHGEEFARAIRPAYAICSNRADHLAPSTFAHYESVGSRVLATCWDGAVTVRIRKGEMQLDTFRRRADIGIGPKAGEPLPGGGPPPPP